MSDLIPEAPAATAVTMPFFALASEEERSDTAPEIGPRAPFTFDSTLLTAVPMAGTMLDVRFAIPVLKPAISLVTVFAALLAVDVIGFTT